MYMQSFLRSSYDRACNWCTPALTVKSAHPNARTQRHRLPIHRLQLTVKAVRAVARKHYCKTQISLTELHDEQRHFFGVVINRLRHKRRTYTSNTVQLGRAKFSFWKGGNGRWAHCPRAKNNKIKRNQITRKLLKLLVMLVHSSRPLPFITVSPLATESGTCEHSKSKSGSAA